MNDQPLQVLLIEDNPGDARLIRAMLADPDQPPSELVWVDRLNDGIAHLRSNHADVVLLDLGLPESVGIDTVRRLLAGVAGTPTLIVLSGLNDEATALRAVQAGAQDYLVKGRVDAGLLARAMRYAIERRQAKKALRQAHDELERRVAERTAELANTVAALHIEIGEREQAERRLRESQSLLRQLAARSDAVREEERKYLTREIHDELGQYLSALRLNVSVLGLRFGAANPELEASTRNLVGLVDSTIKVVRDVVAALRPAVLDLGIVSALEWLADEFVEHTALACRLRVDEASVALDEQRATDLFRIVQESLTNIRRHARARQVEISLTRQGAHYLLEVRDDGLGFDPAKRKLKSFGLVCMRERALKLGGELDLVSTPGRGSRIRLRFPIESVGHEP